MSNPHNWTHKLRVLDRIGVAYGRRVLDYGCGAGATVRSLTEAGFDASGFDINDYVETPTNRIAIGNPSHLPYADGYFDMVFSDQVFEHAQRQEQIFAELRRVTRPGGVHVHIIPAKWQLIEPHTYVPLGGLIVYRWWYRLWAALGIRNGFQVGLGAAEVADLNWQYARNCLNYISTRRYRRIWRELDYRVRFVERVYMETSDKPSVRKMAPLVRIPGLRRLIQAFWVRIVALERPLT